MGEADVIRAAVSAASAGETQLVTYLGVDLFPRRGWMVGLAHELYQEDLSVEGDRATTPSIWRSTSSRGPTSSCWPSRAISSRARGGAGEPSASMFMLQLHYYL